MDRDGFSCRTWTGHSCTSGAYRIALSVGVPEDPVTGSVYCCLCPFWEKRLHKTAFLAYQASSRGVFLRVKMEDTGRVNIGSQAITVWNGIPVL